MKQASGYTQNLLNKCKLRMMQNRPKKVLNTWQKSNHIDTQKM